MLFRSRVVTYDYDSIDAYHDVIRYDHFGVPSQTRVIHTRTVAIPVVSCVRVFN